MTIFESPDGGKTVFSREIGQTDRVRIQEHIHQLSEDLFWGEVRDEAKTNPTLQKLIDRFKIEYYLVKNGRSET